MLRIQDLKLNYIYIREDVNILYKVVYINHNSNWAICIRFYLNDNFGDVIIIDDKWLSHPFEKNIKLSNDPNHYTLIGSSIRKNDTKLINSNHENNKR